MGTSKSKKKKTNGESQSQSQTQSSDPFITESQFKSVLERLVDTIASSPSPRDTRAVACARKCDDLIAEISHRRQLIDQLKQNLAEEESALSAARLNHQIELREFESVTRERIPV